MTALSPPHRHSVGWLVGLGRAYNKIEEKQNESPKHQYTYTHKNCEESTLTGIYT